MCEFFGPECLYTSRPKFFKTITPKCIGSSSQQHIRGISEHFGPENYVWRLDVVQNLGEFFLLTQEKRVIFLLDEIKIQKYLVWFNNIEEIGKADLNAAILKKNKTNEFASQCF